MDMKRPLFARIVLGDESCRESSTHSFKIIAIYSSNLVRFGDKNIENKNWVLQNFCIKLSNFLCEHFDF